METIVVKNVDVQELRKQKELIVKLSSRFEGKTLIIVNALAALLENMLESSSEAIEVKDKNESEMLEEFNKHFTEINPNNLIQFTDLYKRGELYAFDLRDGSDFKIEPEHEILHMISTGDFLFGKEKQKDMFPNGFDDWHETHYEISSRITEMKEREGNTVPLTISLIQGKKGRGGMYELAKELTDKFEELNKGVEWDGEYFDAHDEFIEEEIGN